ncbi:MAG: MYG1 family protein [Patescibacteria group bacterium]
MTTIATHNSTYHADDVFAVATILLIEPEARVIRTRDKDLISPADYVVDVGMEYEPEKNRFDHHQLGGAGKRENGIQYASAGLVWRKFGEILAGGKREAEIIDRIFMEPLDAHDNGMPIAEYRYEGIRDYSIVDFFYSYLSKPNDSEENLYKIFMNVVGVAKELLVREINRAKETVLSEVAVEEIYEATKDKRVIILEKEHNWYSTLMQKPEPVYVIYPRNDGVSWGVKCVPATSKVFGTRRKDLPIAWGGKTDEELQKITGVPDALFAHRGLFMASAKTREGAIALAELALNA